MQFKRLNVITKQNGWGGASVTRNALLIPGRETQSDFIYQTPMTYFANKVTPNIRIDQEVSLRLFAGAGAKLVDALGGYFEKLFAAQAAAAPESIRQVRASARYGFLVAAVEGAAAGLSSQAWLENQQQIVAGFPLILIPQYGFKVAYRLEAGPCKRIVRRAVGGTNRDGEAKRGRSGRPGPVLLRRGGLLDPRRQHGAKPVNRIRRSLLRPARRLRAVAALHRADGYLDAVAGDDRQLIHVRAEILCGIAHREQDHLEIVCLCLRR